MKYALAFFLVLAPLASFAKNEPWSCAERLAMGQSVTFDQLLTEQIYRFAEETTLGLIAEYRIRPSSDTRASRYDYVVHLTMVDEDGNYRDYEMAARVWGGGSVSFAQPQLRAE